MTLVTADQGWPNEPMLGLAERTWSTRGHATDRQLDAWRQMVTEAFVPVALCGKPDQEGFDSSCSARRVGDLGVAWLASQPQAVERTAEHAGRGPGGMYFVNLPLRGGGVAIQDGRRSVTRAGDFVVVDADRPFRLEFDGAFDQLSLMVPHTVLDPLLAAPTSIASVVVPGDDGAGAVASAAIRALAAQRTRLYARQTSGLVAHVVGLLALALGTYAPTAQSAAREVLLQAALDEVERELADPDLSIDGVARRLHISTSYLTKLFATRGTTFGRHLLERRLALAWSLLDPDAPHGSGAITRVVHAAGFRDSSHFARVFRERYGITPTERLAGQTGR